MKTIFERVVPAIREALCLENGSIILPTSRLIEDLGADSLDQEVLAIELEKEFGIKLTREDSNGLFTVRLT